VSDNGLFLSLSQTSTLYDQVLVWIDVEGNEVQSLNHTRDMRDQKLSPDGKHIAVTIGDENGQSDIWVIERERDMLTRLTVDQSIYRDPLWSHDQQWIYFSSDRADGTSTISRKRADGTGLAEKLTEAQNSQFPQSLSPDGKYLLFTEFREIEGACLYKLHLTGDERGKVEPFLVNQFENRWAAISPDGKWVAYVSNITGTHEVYVQQFPDGGHRIKISSGRGIRPRWMPDGSKIVYKDGDEETYYSVTISETNGSIRPSPPELLFTLDPEKYSNATPDYDIAADGKRFLFTRTVGVADSTTQPTLVTNWFSELKELVAAP
jgi:Tol biopolymer transport system component